MQLNRYLAHSGIASRRKSTDLIKLGLVKVNKLVISNPSYQVQELDNVTFNNKLVKPEQKFYILLNKPKDCITTRLDEFGRKTVLDLVKVPAHLHPIGRLDRDTTGALLLTNDGDLTQKLAHPRFNIKKTYKATLKKNLTTEQAETIKKGFFLPDGFIKPDILLYHNDVVTITLHSGKKHIVKRIFQHIGNNVKKLDRINFAGITKKNLSKGHWRHLTKKEITMLKKL